MKNGMNRTRWRLAAAAVAAALGLAAPLALAGPASAATCTTSAYMGHCPFPGYPGFADFTSDGYVDNNVWGPVSGQTQTLTANSPGDWNVVENIGSNPSGAVTTYPNGGMLLPEVPLTNYTDIVSAFADTIPSAAGNSGWQGYDNWFNNWGDEVMIQTQWVGTAPCSYVAVQQFGGSNGVPVQTWGLCDFGGPGGEKVWKLAPPGTTVGSSATMNEASGSVDVSAMTKWLITNGYMLRSTAAATTVTALSAGFEICDTPAGGSTWTYTNLTFTDGGTPIQQPPSATTGAATGVTDTAATLNGSVNPNGAATTWQIVWGLTSGYGNTAGAGSAGSGTTAVPVSAGLAGLAPSTTYHYRVEATNSAGTTFGSDQVFTTAPSGGGGAAVAFAAQAGASKTGTAPLSWSINVGSGSNRALLVETTVGVPEVPGDTGCTQTLTDGAATVKKLGVFHTNNAHAGFMDVWSVIGPPAGVNNLTMSVSGCSSPTLTAVAEAFTGVAQVLPPGSPVTLASAAGWSNLASKTITPASASDMVAAFAAAGTSLQVPGAPATHVLLKNVNSNTGAGNSGGATAPGSASPVTVNWGLAGSDYWALVLGDIAHA